MDRQLIETYARGGQELAAAIDGLEPEDLVAAPASGWTIQQIVIHLMDSDLIASDRMKRVIAEDNPTIIGFDESAFARELHYDLQDPFLAAEIFDNNRQLTAVVLRNLPDKAFERFGTHSERGKVTLAGFLKTYTEHLTHHLKFILEKRAALGKPIKE